VGWWWWRRHHHLVLRVGLKATRVLVVNAGSSSVKLALVDGDERVDAALELDAPDGAIDPAELAHALDGLGDADAVGHRIVHGGLRLRDAVVVDAAVREEIERLCELASLQQPRALTALDAVSAALPGLPAVACFDTAFHATLPPAAATYALPRALIERFGLRRYGFHGLSHAWVARRAPELLAAREAAGLRIVSCHLGSGASLCAISGGRSVDTTMGFTPLEGLVMATRSGSVDPGLLLWLLDRGALSTGELGRALEHESGLFGLTGSADMREVLERAGRGDAAAQLGLDVYLHSLRGAIAAMVASLGGLDVLVFTGGVGEHSAAVRERAVAGLAFLGVEIDPRRNAEPGGDADVSSSSASARTLVIAAREDLEIARGVRELLGG
jgi:acetate kinase